MQHHVCYSQHYQGWTVLTGPVAPANTIRSYEGHRSYTVARAMSRILNRCEEAHLLALIELVAGLNSQSLQGATNTTPQ